MGKKVTVVIAAHKQYRMPEDNMYLPVQVGAANNKSIGYQRDDEGENISSLNPFFCELTGLYWAWKNLHSDYIGLVHYRRHFSYHPKSRNLWDSVLKQREIEGDLGKVLVFIPVKRKYYIETLYSHYEHTHYAYQLDETRKIIKEQCPDYLDIYDKTLNQRWGYMFNMMIMTRELLDDYCKWLFGILFELRSRLGEDGLTPFHSRYYGRISEIIFNVWINQMISAGKLKRSQIKEVPLIHMEKVDWFKKGSAFLKAKFIGKKYEGSF